MFAAEHDSGKNHIFVAMDIQKPEINIPKLIACQYMHFIQWCEGRPYDEEEADKFAHAVAAAVDEELGRMKNEEDLEADMQKDIPLRS